MLPKKLHLEQINRYHDKLDSLEKEIDSETDTTKKLALSMAWYKLHKHWRVIDDAVEFTRDTINDIERELRKTK